MARNFFHGNPAIDLNLRVVISIFHTCTYQNPSITNIFGENWYLITRSDRFNLNIGENIRKVFSERVLFIGIEGEYHGFLVQLSHCVLRNDGSDVRCYLWLKETLVITRIIGPIYTSKLHEPALLGDCGACSHLCL